MGSSSSSSGSDDDGKDKKKAAGTRKKDGRPLGTLAKKPAQPSNFKYSRVGRRPVYNPDKPRSQAAVSGKKRKLTPTQKKARKILVARRVLEIFAQGGSRDDVEKEYGPPVFPSGPNAGRAMTGRDLREWAHQALLGHEATLVGQALVVDELYRLGFFDLNEIAEWDGATFKLKPFNRMTAAQRAAIQEIYQDKDGNIRFKTADKLRSLEMLGKVFQMFVTRVEASGPGGGPVEINMDVGNLSRDERDLLRRLLAKARPPGPGEEPGQG